jgi:hypothetical protein
MRGFVLFNRSDLPLARVSTEPLPTQHLELTQPSMALIKLSLLVAAATALAPAPTLRTVSRRSFGGLVVAAPGVASAAGTKLENGQALPDGALQSAAAPSRARARRATRRARRFDRFRKVQAEWNRFGSRLERGAGARERRNARARIVRAGSARARGRREAPSAAGRRTSTTRSGTACPSSCGSSTTRATTCSS